MGPWSSPVRQSEKIAVVNYDGPLTQKAKFLYKKVAFFSTGQIPSSNISARGDNASNASEKVWAGPLYFSIQPKDKLY
jgi:hypothetical protein